MIRFAKVRRMINSFVSEVSGLGGVTQNRFVSPKGLYSNPKGEDAIVIPLLDGVSQDIILAIQKPVDLLPGDVLITDDKSTIHLKFDGKEIAIKTKSLSIVADDITIDANKMTVTAETDFIGNVKITGDVDITGGVATVGTLKNNGKNVGSTHMHQQMPDGGAGGVPTSPPV